MSYTFAQTPSQPVTINNTYVQTFDGLLPGLEGAYLPFVQGVTVPGWWANSDQYITSDGTDNEGGL